MSNFKKRRFNRSKRLTIAKVNKKVDKLQSKVEIKELDTFQVLALTGGIDNAFSLNTMGRGNQNDQRVGNKVYMKLLELKVRIKLALTDQIGTNTGLDGWTLTYQDGTMRVLLVMDRQNNGAAGIDVSQLLINSGTQENKIISVYDYKFVDSLRDKIRYKILYDRTFYISQNIVQDIQIRKFIRLNHKVSFNDGNTGSATDIINNDLRLVFIPNNNNLQFSFNTNLFYSDT